MTIEVDTLGAAAIITDRPLTAAEQAYAATLATQPEVTQFLAAGPAPRAGERGE